MENGFMLLLALLCAVLTILQFRWTGELAKAEYERMGGRQIESSRDFATDFDTRLRRSCDALVPAASEMNEAGMRKRVGEWVASSPRPIFGRLALAIPENGELKLQSVDVVTGSLQPIEWPEEWSALHDNLSRKLSGGSPPYSDDTGLLLEFPIRGSGSGLGVRSGGGNGPPGGPGGSRGFGEVGWMILELDRAYLTSIWFPDLTARHLNRTSTPLYQAKVIQRSGQTLFTTGPDQGLEESMSVPLQFQGRGSGRSGPPMEPQWTLETRRREGTLEKLVAASRIRNLMLAVCVNGLILVAGGALVRLTRKSRRLAEDQMNFVASVSHELRTPLTVIRGAAHNIKRGIVQSPEAIDRYSGMILQHADQLTDMVAQVLDFSVAKKGKLLAKDLQKIRLRPLLDEAITNTRTETETCQVEVNIPADLPEVSGDPGPLRRAFQNLIANAAKHGGNGGWIGITARAAGNRVEIAVADRGPGIPKDEQSAIFNAFYRGEAAHTAQVRGSGLGLSLVKEIIEAHGGTISICSEAGDGATFVASLPVAAGVP
jgi:signal transduction histidine kinase